MKHQLPLLAYPLSALEPFVSAETLRFHYGKHHQAYVDQLNTAIHGSEYEPLSLVDLVLKAPAGPIFNNAAQHWNHSFLWRCLNPKAEPSPEGDLKLRIEEQYGTVDQFRTAFEEAALSVFGSGWAWLVRTNDSGKIELITTSNADNPLRMGLQPLLTCDVWEHAYYIDYRNDRRFYLRQLWNVIDWRFVESNYESEGVRSVA